MKRSESFPGSDKGSKIGIKASWVRSGKEEVASFQLDLAEADLTMEKGMKVLCLTGDEKLYRPLANLDCFGKRKKIDVFLFRPNLNQFKG